MQLHYFGWLHTYKIRMHSSRLGLLNFSHYKSVLVVGSLAWKRLLSCYLFYLWKKCVSTLPIMLRKGVLPMTGQCSKIMVINHHTYSRAPLLLCENENKTFVTTKFNVGGTRVDSDTHWILGQGTTTWLKKYDHFLAFQTLLIHLHA